MDARSLFVLKCIFYTVAALAAILAALFELRHSMQTDKERAKTAAIYGDRWQAIRDSGVLELPEKVVSWYVKAVRDISCSAMHKVVDLPKWLLGTLMIVVIPAYVLLAGWFSMGWIWLLIFGLLALTSFTVFLLGKLGYIDPADIVPSVIGNTYVITTIAATLFWLDIILRLDIAYASILMLALLPLLIVILGFAIALIGDIADEVSVIRLDFDPYQSGFIGIATAASFTITVLSLLLGHLAAPESWIPKTVQMISVNVVCDGLTLYFTLLILSHAVRFGRRPDSPPQSTSTAPDGTLDGGLPEYDILKGWLPIPLAVILDLAAGAFLACASLYLGLIFTEYALSLKEVGRVLIGLSVDGQRFEIGPYFWAMHTAFIPTLVYLSLILFCWLCKLIVLPIATIFSKAHKVKQPLHVTACAMILIVTVFTAVATGIGFMEEKARNSAVTSAPGGNANHVPVEPAAKAGEGDPQLLTQE